MKRIHFKLSFQQAIAIVTALGLVVMLKYRYVPHKASFSAKAQSPIVERVIEPQATPVIEKLKEELAKEAGISTEEFFGESPTAPLDPQTPAVVLHRESNGESLASEPQGNAVRSVAKKAKRRSVPSRQIVAISVEDLAGPLLEHELSLSAEEAEYAIDFSYVAIAVAELEPAGDELEPQNILDTHQPLAEAPVAEVTAPEEAEVAEPEAVEEPQRATFHNVVAQDLSATEGSVQTQKNMLRAVRAEAKELAAMVAETTEREAEAVAIAPSEEKESTPQTSEKSIPAAREQIAANPFEAKQASVAADLARAGRQVQMAIQGSGIQAAADPETIHGLVKIDGDLQAWLDSHGGHLEIFYYPEGNADPSLRRPANYTYGEEQFSIEGSAVPGPSRIAAAVFTPKSELPIWPLHCGSTLISPTTRERVRCHFTEAARSSAEKVASSRSGNGAVPLRIAVFGEAEYQAVDAKTGMEVHRPVPISGAKVRFVNVPELPSMQTDESGDLRIPRVPAHSTYLVDVEAPNYFPTRAQVIVGGTVAYQSITLVSKKFVSGSLPLLPMGVRQRAAQSETAVVVAKVFQEGSFVPKSGERVLIGTENRAGTFYDYFPNPKRDVTSAATGLEVFFGVQPGLWPFRLAEHNIPLLIPLRPDYGYFVSFGQSPSTVSGRVVDPVGGPIVGARIRPVFSREVVAVTDDQGHFQLSKISNPPGSLLLEVEADGYPKSWFTVAVHGGVKSAISDLVLPSEDVADAVLSHSKLERADKSNGMVYAKAARALFRSGTQCVFAHLDPVDRKLNQEIISLPMGESERKAKGICLERTGEGLVFPNVPNGEYTVRWSDDWGRILRMSHVYVGADRQTFLVD